MLLPETAIGAFFCSEVRPSSCSCRPPPVSPSASSACCCCPLPFSLPSSPSSSLSPGPSEPRADEQAYADDAERGGDVGRRGDGRPDRVVDGDGSDRDGSRTDREQPER